MTIAIVMGLVACDNNASLGNSAPDNTATDAQTALVNTSQQEQATRPGSSRKGPHGSSHDPHANLSPDKYAQVALQHHNEGRPALAMDTLNQAIEKYPKSSSLHGVRCSLYLEQGSSAAALAVLNKAVELDPPDAGFLTNRAQAYRSFGRTEEAMADLDSAIELDKNFVAARFNLSLIHI